AADVEGVRRQIQDLIGIDASDAIACSAKTGQGIDQILEHIVYLVPHPREPQDELLRALVFDSHYDTYRGVMTYVRVISGEVKKGTPIRLMAVGKSFEVSEVGIFAPRAKPIEVLGPGEVGYLIAGIKNVTDVRIGETVTNSQKPAPHALPGFKIVKPVVF